MSGSAEVQQASGTGPETLFARVLGRQPSDREKIEVYRLRDALGLEDNDAVFGILLAFQNFRWLFDEHPARIEAAAQRAMENAAKGAEAVAAAEMAKIRSGLTAAVASAAESVAKKQTEVARWRASWLASSFLALFGGLMLVCGFELGRGGLPPWMRIGIATAGPGWEKVAAAILGAPAGWVALMLLLPVLASVMVPTWERARDASAAVRARRTAAFRLAIAVLGWLVSAVCLTQLVPGWR